MIAPLSRPTLRTATWVRAAAVAVALLMVCWLVVTRSTSAFSAGTSAAGNTITTGSVSLENNRGTAMFNVSGASPGTSYRQCVEVTYTGSAAATGEVRLYGSSSGASTLSPYLDLVVQRGSPGSTCPSATGTPASPTTIVDTRELGATAISHQAFVADHTGYADGVSTAWTPTAGEKQAYAITFEVQDVPAAQGKTATPTFVWEVKG